MSDLSKTTQDHDEIRRWCEARGGKPAHAEGPGDSKDVGLLRIDFPGYSGEGKLGPLSWDAFFKKFDELGLAFVYQEKTAEGKQSNFNKLVGAGTAAEKPKAQHATASGADTSPGSHTK